MSDELRKTQEVCAALRQQLDAANLQVHDLRRVLGPYSTVEIALKAWDGMNQRIKDLEAIEGRLKKEIELTDRHSQEGWDLANKRTAQWKDAERLNEEYRKILQRLEWTQDSEVGGYWCPMCCAQKCQGHTEDCGLGHALHGAFPPGEVGPTEKPKCEHEPIPLHVGNKIQKCAKCGDHFEATEKRLEGPQKMGDRVGNAEGNSTPPPGSLGDKP